MTDYKKIPQGDKEFHFVSGYTIVSRASLEISDLCPEHMKLMIHRAMGEGYLKLVAYVPDAEYAWEKLQS